MVLTSTTSLAQGVNLPVRRVIIKDSFKGFDAPENHLTPQEYKQMSGRAGRAGIDTEGESILMVRPSGDNRAQLAALVQVRWAAMPSMQACGTAAACSAALRWRACDLPPARHIVHG
jgi:DNA polymerase theta